MTKQELEKLKELATEVDKLREKADELETRIRNFYRDEEDVLDRDAHMSDWNAHMQLSYAGAAIKDAVPCITDALIGLQKAYKAEKECMDFYDGILL